MRRASSAAASTASRRSCSPSERKSRPTACGSARTCTRWSIACSPTLPPGVTIDLFGDAAAEVEHSLGTLYTNAAAGLLLVLLLLWVAIGARNATMAAIGLPVALAGAIIAMHMMGITINMMSLLALILCLGVVVDDAIIIIENIYRHMEEGMPRRKAAVVGTQEVFWPVVASTLTSWAAFLPLLLMEGVLGISSRSFPRSSWPRWLRR